MQFYSAKKKEEIMLHAQKWMEVEIIILNEIWKIQKKSCFLLVLESRL
jgi:hypothetical protein